MSSHEDKAKGGEQQRPASGGRSGGKQRRRDVNKNTKGRNPGSKRGASKNSPSGNEAANHSPQPRPGHKDGAKGPVRDRNNGRRRGDQKFARRLRPQRGGRSGKVSSENSPAVGSKNNPTHHTLLDPPNPPQLKLGPGNAGQGASVPWSRRQDGQEPQGYKRGGQGNPKSSAPQKWGPTPEGLTDLSRKKYSVPWLLQRRENKKSKDCPFELPSELYSKLRSPKTQGRRYPFIKQHTGRSRHDDEEVPAWMEDEDLDKDFNFKVFDQSDKDHFKQFGTVKDAQDVKVISLAEHEESQARKKEAEEQAVAAEFQKPVTHNDILQAFAGMEKNDDDGDFNPDNMFAAEAAPAVSNENDPNDPWNTHGVTTVRPEEPAPVKEQPKPDPPSGADFLESFMMKPPSHHPHHPTPDALLGPKKPPGVKGIMATDLPSERTRSQAQSQAMPPTNPYQAAQDMSRRQPQKRPDRKGMSVNPGQLAYASRSATKAMRQEIVKLGYSIVQPRSASSAETEEERNLLRYQESIRKIYDDAIMKANAIFYSQHHVRGRSKRAAGNVQEVAMRNALNGQNLATH